MKTPAKLKPPRLLSGILLTVGTLFLLLLNGQHFTNRVIFVAFVASSAFLWFRFRLSNASNDSVTGRIPLLIHVAVFVIFSATLPDAYRQQEKFNTRSDRIKTILQAYEP